MKATLSLEPKLDLTAAAGLHAALLPLVEDDICLDAGQVDHLGALCTQILIAAARATRAGGHRIMLTNVSDRVLKQLAAMGMTPESIMEGL